MEQLTLLFVILLATVLAVPVSARFALPAPVLMTLFGAVLALIPAVPNPTLEPSLILPLVLPPLLFAAARRAHWRQYRANWRVVVLLAFALVLVSTAAVALVFHLIAPGLPIAAAVLLGALISPPDPVAASAVAGHIGLPRRLLNALETEGLFNDVTAIVLYEVALQAVLTRHFSPGGALGELVLSAVIAIAVGLAMGWLSNRVMGVLGDATLQVALSLLVPYAAYAIADHIHGSGVLSVLMCGLYLSDRTDADDVAYRLVGTAFWDILELLVTGVAFGLVGQELHTVVNQIGGAWSRMLGDAMTIVAVVVLVRLFWLLPAARLAERIGRVRRRAADPARRAEARPGAPPDADAPEPEPDPESAPREQDEPEPAPRPASVAETIVMWWAGMRGVASVALALAVPFTLDDGAPFPGRGTILFTAFVVVLFTLVVQGLTLAPLTRLLRIGRDETAEREAERRLWARVAKAQLHLLNEAAEQEDLPEDLYERLVNRQQARIAAAFPEAAEEVLRAAGRIDRAHLERFNQLDQRMIAAGRREMLTARAEPGADPELVDKVLRQLDLRSRRH